VATLRRLILHHLTGYNTQIDEREVPLPVNLRRGRRCTGNVIRKDAHLSPLCNGQPNVLPLKELQRAVSQDHGAGDLRYLLKYVYLLISGSKRNCPRFVSNLHFGKPNSGSIYSELINNNIHFTNKTEQ
jgi:hypothetical protein